MRYALKKKIEELELEKDGDYKMSLDIYSSDEVKNFHIGYLSFSIMRAFFVLHYGENLYHVYDEILKNLGYCDDKVWFDLCDKIGDLSILINHSDCDGKLTSDECKKLRECLFIDEYKIKTLEYSDYKYRINMIELMYEFIDLVDYAVENNVELIFG